MLEILSLALVSVHKTCQVPADAQPGRGFVLSPAKGELPRWEVMGAALGPMFSGCPVCPGAGSPDRIGPKHPTSSTPCTSPDRGRWLSWEDFPHEHPTPGCGLAAGGVGNTLGWFELAEPCRRERLTPACSPFWGWAPASIAQSAFFPGQEVKRLKECFQVKLLRQFREMKGNRHLRG